MPRGHGAQDPAGGLDWGIGVIDIVVDDEDAQGGCEVSHLVYGLLPGRGMNAKGHKPVDRGDHEVPRGRASDGHTACDCGCRDG